jgi:elongator complex protein 1
MFDHHIFKDPKEFLPYLNELQQLEPDYQMYTIDKKLKRYRSALKHIVNCGQNQFLLYIYF